MSEKLDCLTARELEVLTLVALGYQNPAIAESLCLSLHTVKTHIANILRKMEKSSRLEAAIEFYASRPCPHCGVVAGGDRHAGI